MGSAIIYGARNVDEKKDNGMGRASREAKVSSIAREVSVCMIIFASSLTLIATCTARNFRGRTHARRVVSSHHFPLLFAEGDCVATGAACLLP